MRQQQVASSEGAPASVARKVTVKNGRREDPVGEENYTDCLKLGNRRVLVKIPGNRLKVTTGTPTQGKHSNDQDPAADNAHIEQEQAQKTKKKEEKKEEDVLASEPAASKRPPASSDGPGLPQWGQRKRLRFNNRGDVKANPEGDSAASDVKPLPRRGSVKAEKTPALPTVRIKRPAAAAVSKPSPPELASADNVKRSVEASANGSHLVSEPYASRVAEVHSERPLATPEKPSVTASAQPPPAAAAAGAALPGVGGADNVHLDRDRAAHSEKVDMDLFQWPKFIVSLSRKDKEDDFFAIKGTKLPVRPKKRSKHLEKAVTFISPGAWLCDITSERYEVKEKKTIKKRPRGLKAMGSADSDTD